MRELLARGSQRMRRNVCEQLPGEHRVEAGRIAAEVGCARTFV